MFCKRLSCGSGSWLMKPSRLRIPGIIGYHGDDHAAYSGPQTITASCANSRRSVVSARPEDAWRSCELRRQQPPDCFLRSPSSVLAGCLWHGSRPYRTGTNCHARGPPQRVPARPWWHWPRGHTPGPTAMESTKDCVSRSFNLQSASVFVQYTSVPFFSAF